MRVPVELGLAACCAAPNLGPEEPFARRLPSAGLGAVCEGSSPLGEQEVVPVRVAPWGSGHREKGGGPVTWEVTGLRAGLPPSRAGSSLGSREQEEEAERVPAWLWARCSHLAAHGPNPRPPPVQLFFEGCEVGHVDSFCF